MEGDLDKIELKIISYKYVAMEVCIYMIEVGDCLYIGSTNDIKQRQSHHNWALKKGCKYPIYNHCRDNGITKLELIELEYVDIEDRYIVEQYYIDEFKTGHKLLNCVNASFDRGVYMKEYNKTYKEENKDNDRAYKKAYQEANKDKIRERKKAYHEENRDKIKAKIKAYQEANKDKMREYKKAYHQANKDKIKAYYKAYYEANKESRI